jgi:hypothetical protein
MEMEQTCILRAYFMAQSLSWNANRFSAIQQIPCVLWKRNKPVYYVLTAWSSVRFEKAVKKFPAFYGNGINLYITYLLYETESFLF